MVRILDRIRPLEIASVPTDRAFTIRLDGPLLDRLLREAEEAGCPPNTFVRRVVVSVLRDETKLEILRELEEGSARVQETLEREVRSLRADLVTSLEAILLELRSVVSTQPLSPEAKAKYEAKVRSWIDSLRSRTR